MSPVSKRLWSLGGGKGGVGRSLLTATMGISLARMGRSVVVVDASLGLPNLHSYLATKTPSWSLLDVLRSRVSITEAMIQTPVPGLSLLACTGDAPGTAELPEGYPARLMQCITDLAADHILIDLAGGTTSGILDLFNLSENAIVITTPNPTSIQTAYVFVKNALYRKLQQDLSSRPSVQHALRQVQWGTDKPRHETMTQFSEMIAAADPQAARSLRTILQGFRPRLLVNMATYEAGREAAEAVQSAAKKYLNVDIDVLDSVNREERLHTGAGEISSWDLDNPGCGAISQIRRAVQNLLREESAAGAAALDRFPRGDSESSAFGINEILDFMGRQLHVQTEDLGRSRRCIKTQVFCNGRVVLSTQAEYPPDLQAQSRGHTVMELMRSQHYEVIREIESKRARIETA